MSDNPDFSSLCSSNEGLRKKRKSRMHTSSIIVVRFKPSCWYIFRELIRAANVRGWCTPVVWILTGWPTYASVSKLSQSASGNLSEEVSRMKKRGKKKKVRRERKRGGIEEQHYREMVGLDLQLQTQRSMERRIIPRSRLSWPVFEVKAIEA